MIGIGGFWEVPLKLFYMHCLSNIQLLSFSFKHPAELVLNADVGNAEIRKVTVCIS